MSLIDVELRDAVAQALRRAQRKGDLPRFEIPGDIHVERPKQQEMGDFATAVCMQLARHARMSPMSIAEVVVKYLSKPASIGSVDIAHPGFINFRLSESWLTSQVETILAASGASMGVDVGQGRRVQVEYVSANPTGPLHMGSARNAVLGDVLASVLEASGYVVEREYYVNDAGSRMRAFYETLYARYAQALGCSEDVPADGYSGAYMSELGSELAATHGSRFLELHRDEALIALGALGLEAVVAQAEADLALMGVHYDRWFSEQCLYADGQHERIMTILREGGYLDLHDGAVWFLATALGGDKDEVILRSDGTPGYFASDVAYHYGKFVERGFDWVIDVWGADHQGHAPRMKAMMKALGLAEERLTLIIYQLVTLKRGGEVVRLSKRTGDIITLREVVEEVGSDAMRYFLLSRSADSQMEFDLDLAKEQSDVNPVYYIQYAHARICSILRFAAELDGCEGDVSLLTHPSELALIRRMIQLPEVVRTAATQLAPHHLAYYAYELASAVHAFYRDCRVVSSELGDEKVTRARLKLASAVKLVLSGVLKMMGMGAPEVM